MDSGGRVKRAAAAALVTSAAVLLGLGPACAQAPTAAAPEPARAAELVANWIDAAGGPDLWDRVTDLRYTITTVWYDTSGAELRRRPRHVWIQKHAGGFRVRVERGEAEGAYVQVWDGTSAWATLNGRALPDTARAVSEIEYVAGDLTYWIGLPWKLRDPGVRLQWSRSDGRGPGEVLHVTFGSGVGLHDGDQYWYYFPEATRPLPREVHYLEEGHPATDRTRTLWSDWRRVGPALHVGRRLIVDPTGRPLRALLIRDVAPNAGLSDALFDRPRGDGSAQRTGSSSNDS
ncbi:MAG: hypothetical protein ACRELD_07300 [Longimicrobiales bacterium]